MRAVEHLRWRDSTIRKWRNDQDGPQHPDLYPNSISRQAIGGDSILLFSRVRPMARTHLDRTTSGRVGGGSVRVTALRSSCDRHDSTPRAPPVLCPASRGRVPLW